MRTHTRWWLLLLVAALVVLATVEHHAQACGGFFCDRPGSSGQLPIAQSAENVLFVLDRDRQTGQGRVEAHIQIIYTGAADQFSWVVPVTATPTLDVGNDILFDRLEPATRPRYQLTYQMSGTCQGLGGGGSSGCLPGGSGASTFNSSAPKDGGMVNMPSVQVLFRGNVGPYDSAVVKSDDPGALKAWLDGNGYFVSADAVRIIDDYVAAKSSFVALRLRQGQDTSAIAPIVLRFASDEGCLPLKLTAIAATPDVRINVWVLGSGRAVPVNYTEIGLNFAKLDWFNGGKNYDELLGQAADEAGGNAFAVEYAQDAPPFAAQFTITEAQRSILAGEHDPGLFLSQLRNLGFNLQGAVLQVLRKDLPLPPTLAAQGVTETQYYQNIDQFWFQTAAAGTSTPSDPFQPTVLVNDLKEMVFTPLTTFEPLFQSHHTLTRLATFISPDEMNKDPIFITSSDLPNVSPNHNVTATLLCGDQEFDTCHAPVRLQTDDGTQIVFPVASDAPVDCTPSVQPTYDRGDLDQMPASTVGYARAADSDGTISIDNRAAIATALAKHNAAAISTTGGSGGACSVTAYRRGAALPILLLLAWTAARRRRQRSTKE